MSRPSGESELSENPTFHPTKASQEVAGLRSLFHRTMKTPDPKCANATVRDRPAPSVTIRSDLSRWRHEFEPRWDCEKDQLRGYVSRTPPRPRIQKPNKFRLAEIRSSNTCWSGHRSGPEFGLRKTQQFHWHHLAPHGTQCDRGHHPLGIRIDQIDLLQAGLRPIFIL